MQISGLHKNEPISGRNQNKEISAAVNISKCLDPTEINKDLDSIKNRCFGSSPKKISKCLGSAETNEYLNPIKINNYLDPITIKKKLSWP
jgi:hypothetical protein